MAENWSSFEGGARDGQSAIATEKTSSPTTHISRKAIVMKRKMQLRKSLAAKARGGGKVATMVQKFQEEQHAEEEDLNETSGSHAGDMEVEKMSELSPTPPQPMVDEQTTPPSTPPRVQSEPESPCQSPSPAPEEEQKPASPSSSQKEEIKPSSSFESTTSSHMSYSSSQTHSTYSTLSTAHSGAAADNTDIQSQDIQKLRSERDDLHTKLKKYETDFVATHGREVETFDDLEPVAHMYRQYVAAKKECTRRTKKKASAKSANTSTNSPSAVSPARRSSSNGIPALDRISEVSSEHEVTDKHEQPSSRISIGSSASHNEDDVGIYRRDEYVAIEPEKSCVETNRPLSSKSNAKSHRPNGHADTKNDNDVVVSAVAAILEYDRRHKVEDPGDIVLIPGEESSSFCQAAEREEDSIASEPSSEPGHIAPSPHQPFDEIIRPQPSRMSREASAAETPERSNRSKKLRRQIAQNEKKKSPASVASLSVEKRPRRLGARPMLSTDDNDKHLAMPKEPPPLLSVVSSASSSGIMHHSEAESPTTPISYRSSSKTPLLLSPLTSCLADDASNFSAHFIGSADELHNDTDGTPTIARIRQSATSSRNVSRSRYQSAVDALTCRPRESDIGSIDSEGPPEVCRTDVCKVATPDKASQYSSQPMPIEGANSFIVNVAEKNMIEEKEEEGGGGGGEDNMPDLTFATLEEATWTKMVDEMVKSLEDDVDENEDSLGEQSDPSNVASANMKADASASKMSLLVEELDSLKAEFDGISKELSSSNCRLKQLELDIEERDQMISTLQLERDLAQADVKHLQDKLSRMKKVMKMKNGSNRKKIKSKDAQIALLHSTIDKLIHELNVSKQAASLGNGVVVVPPSTDEGQRREDQKIISGNANPRSSWLDESRVSSPLHPDDEMDDDPQNRGMEKEQMQEDLLATLVLPAKSNQRSRAIDICKKNNRKLTEPSSSSTKPSDYSESASSFEEALEYIQSFNVNEAIDLAPELEETDTVEERSHELTEVVSNHRVAVVGGKPSVEIAEAPSEELDDDETRTNEDRNECSDLAPEICCNADVVQEASNFVQNINDNWCEGNVS